MPIYKFRCNSCENEFTLIRKMSDKGDVICPHCGSNLADKLICKSSFSLKGAGWYKDNYSSVAKEKPKESDG